jgi:long-chain fatty acid transport protein
MRRALGALLVLGCLAGPARANVFEEYGFGARAAAMGNAHVAASKDYTAAFYNPAALTVRKSPHVGTGLNVVIPRLTITHDEAAGADAPADRLPQTNVGVNLGLLFPLGGLIDNRVAFGAGLYLPTIRVTRVDSLPAETPHFYRYNSLPDKIMLALGAAFEVHETVSVGVGYQFLGSLDGEARVALDLLTQRFTRKELKVDVHADTGILAGVHVRPMPGLSLGFSFRDALQLRYDLVTDVTIKDVGRLVADVRGTSLYTPQQFSWGAAYDPIERLTLSADLVWSRWSQAPDPTARFTVTLDGEPLGFDSLEADAAPVDLGAQDTVGPRAGAEWRMDEAWAFRAGYALRPTPLPAQTGRTNYIDSDAHQVGLGVGFSFPDPLAIHRAPLTIDLAGQLSWLAARRAQKVDADDAVGSYESGGVIWNVATTIRHDFY